MTTRRTIQVQSSQQPSAAWRAEDPEGPESPEEAEETAQLMRSEMARLWGIREDTYAFAGQPYGQGAQAELAWLSDLMGTYLAQRADWVARLERWIQRTPPSTRGEDAPESLGSPGSSEHSDPMSTPRPLILFAPERLRVSVATVPATSPAATGKLAYTDPDASE